MAQQLSDDKAARLAITGLQVALIPGAAIEAAKFADRFADANDKILGISKNTVKGIAAVTAGTGAAIAGREAKQVIFGPDSKSTDLERGPDVGIPKLGFTALKGTAAVGAYTYAPELVKKASNAIGLNNSSIGNNYLDFVVKAGAALGAWAAVSKVEQIIEESSLANQHQAQRQQVQYSGRYF